MPLKLDDRDRLRYGSTGALGGFNTGDYGGDRKARNSVKNTFGRIASRYASAPNSLDAVMQDADFRAAFPNARKVGHDKIDFGGVQSDFESGTPVGIVDVLEASDPSNNSAKRWQWLTDDGGALKALLHDQYRRALLAFPDEDVLLGTRLLSADGFRAFTGLTDIVPRQGYKPTGEDRAWGRRLAKRFGCDARYDDQAFRVQPGKCVEPVLDASTVKGGGKAATTIVGTCDPTRGEAVIAFGWATADALAGGLGVAGLLRQDRLGVGFGDIAAHALGLEVLDLSVGQNALKAFACDRPRGKCVPHHHRRLLTGHHAHAVLLEIAPVEHAPIAEVAGGT